MKLLRVVAVIGLFLLSACAEKRWVCYVDRDADSKCIKGDCIEMTEKGLLNCGKGYRVLKVYPLKKAFIYKVNPPTDIQKCREYADEGGK